MVACAGLTFQKKAVYCRLKTSLITVIKQRRNSMVHNRVLWGFEQGGGGHD